MLRVQRRRAAPRQVLSVTSVKDVGGSCSNAPGVAAAAGAAAGGAAAGAAGAAAAGAVGGISATTAIIAGVGAAAGGRRHGGSGCGDFFRQQRSSGGMRGCLAVHIAITVLKSIGAPATAGAFLIYDYPFL